MRENEAYMEGLTAKTNQLKNTFQDLSNNVIQSEMVAGLLDLANAFLSLVNTPVGAWATQVVLLTTAGWGFVKLMQAMGIVKVVVANFQALPLALQAITSAMKGTAAATVATSATMKASLPIFGAIVAAVTAGVAIFDTLTTSLEEQKEIVEGLKGEINTLTSEYDALKNQTDLTEADETRLKILEKQIEANKILLRQEAEKQYYMQFGKGSSQVDAGAGSSGYTSGSSSFTGGIAYGAAQQGTAEVAPSVTTGIERFEKSIQTFNKLQDSIKTVEEAMTNLDTSTVEGAKEMASLQEQYDKLTSQSKTLYESINTTAEELVSMGETMGDNEDPIKNLDEGAQKAYTSYLEMLDAFLNTDDAIEGLNQSQDDLSNSLVSMSESASNAVSELGALDDKYSTLTSAVQEYNSNGALSADTLAKLMELGDEYISMLSFENGQLVFNSEAFNENSEQMRQNAIESAKSAAADRLKAIAQNGVNTEIANSANVASGATGAMWAYSQALDGVASGAWDASFGVEYLMNAMRGVGIKGFSLTADQKTAMQDVLSDYQNFVNLINSTSLTAPTLSSSGGSSGGGGSSSGSAVDPIEEQSKAFQEQIAILEHELKIMEKMGASEEKRIAKSKEIQEAIKSQEDWYRAQGLDNNSEYLRDLEEQWWEYQESIKDIYKEILQSQLEDLQSQQSAYETLFDRIKEVADEQIAALEEQKEAEEEYWDEKIEALEAQNEALEDQIQKEEFLDNLARARQKRVMVYKDGRFQYLEDIDEVSQAQESLEEYERDQVLKEQTEAIEREKDKALAALDDQIKGWEAYKNKWSNVVDEIGSIQDVLLIEQELGIKLEGENWQERIINLGVFSAGYIDKQGNFTNQSINKNGELLRNQYAQIGEEAAILQQRLNNFDTYINAILGVQQNFVNSQKNLASQASKAWGNSLDSFNNYVKDYKKLADELNNVQIKQPSANTSGVGGSGGGMGHWNPAFSTIVGYASGTTSAPGGVSLVGENGPEMRVLNRGDGILPADITKNLWSWGMTTPSAMLATLAGDIDAFGQKIQIVIDKFAPNLPNVQNGEDFANYLKNNFWRAVVQY